MLKMLPWAIFAASASGFIVAHAPRCATSRSASAPRAPRSASAKAVASGLPDADEPLDFCKELNRLQVITERLAVKTGALSSKVDLVDKETKLLPEKIELLAAQQELLAYVVAGNFTMLDQYFRDEISALKAVTVVSTSRVLSLGTQETKAETETEQDPLAISAKDDTFPENGKLQLENIASMMPPRAAFNIASMMPPRAAFTPEACGLFALIVIVDVLKSLYLHL